jgi:solute carrier family 13 (sodium-dependent dicarboxylate transporter), member 2/3/5
MDSKGIVKRIGLFAGPLLGLAILLILPDQYRNVDGSTTAFAIAGRATLVLLIWMAIWWLTEAIDLSATALLPLVVLPLAGANIPDASSESTKQTLGLDRESSTSVDAAT